MRPGIAPGWAGYIPIHDSSRSNSGSKSSAKLGLGSKVVGSGATNASSPKMPSDSLPKMEVPDQHKEANAGSEIDSVSLQPQAPEKQAGEPDPLSTTPAPAVVSLKHHSELLRNLPRRLPASSSSRIPGHFLAVKHVVYGIQSEQELAVCGNPVLGMLHLYRKYVSKWFCKVEKFMSLPQVQIACSSQWAAEQAVVVPFLDNGDSEGGGDSKPLSVNTAPSQTHSPSDEALLLRKALQLYLALRVLRLKPNKEIDELRRFLWTVTTAKMSVKIGVADSTLSEGVADVVDGKVEEAGKWVQMKLPPSLQAAADSSSEMTMKGYFSALQVARVLRITSDADAGTEKGPPPKLPLPPSFGDVSLALQGGQAVLPVLPEPYVATASLSLGSDLYKRLDTDYKIAEATLEECIHVTKGVTQAKMEGVPLNLREVKLAFVRAINTCRIIDISREFPFVSLMCLMLCLTTDSHTNTDADADAGADADTDTQAVAVDNSVSISKQTKGSNSDNEGDSERDERYCYCRQSDVDHMICCETCEEWYHSVCITRGVTKTEINKCSAFVCPGCAILQGTAYPFSWSCACPRGNVKKRDLKVAKSASVKKRRVS